MKQAIKITTVITLLFIGCKNNGNTFNTVIEIKRDYTYNQTTDSTAIITNTSKNKKVRTTIKHTLYPINHDTPYYVGTDGSVVTSTTVVELNAGEQVTKPCQDNLNQWRVTYEIVGETIIK